MKVQPTGVLLLVAFYCVCSVNGQVFLRRHVPKAGGAAHKRNIVRNGTTTTTTTPEPEPEAVLNGFLDGQYFTILNTPSGKFLTVEGRNFTRGANVVAADWNDEDSQKWLTLLVRRGRSHHGGHSARSANPERFVLIPKRQAPAAAKGNANATTSAAYTLDTLPPFTEVLTLDSLTGNLTTEVYQRGSSSQQWLAENAGDGQIFIRNLGNDQCVKNFDYKPGNIFKKIANFINRLRQPYKPKPDPNPLSTLDCSILDVTQKWFCERA